MSEGAFILRMRQGLDFALVGNVIGIGWSVIENLDEVIRSDNSLQNLKMILLELSRDDKSPARSAGSAFGNITRFFLEMKQDDFVIAPADDGKFYLCQIEGEVFKNENFKSRDFMWQRKVRWLNDGQPISRARASTALRKRMKIRQTCGWAQEFIDEIKIIIEKPETLSLHTKILNSRIIDCRKILHEEIDHNQLEVLVENLFKSVGAKTKILPKNSRKPGDVDIEANFFIPVCGLKEIKIGIQVKHHQDRTDKYAIQQLLDRQVVDQYDRLIVITTADGFTQDAYDYLEKIQDINISLMSYDDLSEWLLTSNINVFKLEKEL